MWSENGPCYIIAEAGSNHDGDLNQALQLITAAADAGCDAVKFQLIPPFKREWIPALQTQSDWCKVDWLATPFDLEGVKALDHFDVPFFKIASPEIVNFRLLHAVAGTGRPLVLSTGTASMADVSRALRSVADIPVILLQCTTRYPTPYEQVNLRAMDSLREQFNVEVGLSDHTLGIAVPIAAAALGARIIEKHFTLDKTLPGPDHHYALEPDGLRQMVEGVRQAEAALGTGEKGPQEGELVEARGRQLQWTT